MHELALAKVDGRVICLVLIKDAINFGGKDGHKLVVEKVHHAIQSQLPIRLLIPEDVHEIIPT